MTKSSALTCFLAATLGFSALLMQGCTNTINYDDKPASKTVKSELSDQKLEQVTTELLDAMLDDAEVKKATKSRRPVLAVFGVIDFTADKVDLAKINGQIYNQLSDSNRFRLSDANALANKSAELDLNLYDLVGDPKTTQKLAQPLDANYLLVGEISNVIRTKPKLKQVYYRVSLKLLDEKTGKFLWHEKQELLKSEKKIIYGI